MRKKSLLILLLIMVLPLLLCGCQSKSEVDQEKTERAMILLPDGSIVEGVCTHRLRYSANWQEVVVDGVTYTLNDWRVVIIEEKKK